MITESEYLSQIEALTEEANKGNAEAERQIEALTNEFTGQGAPPPSTKPTPQLPAIYHELFPNGIGVNDMAVHALIVSICALAQEIREHRLLTERMYEADQEKEAEDAERRAERDASLLGELSKMRGTMENLPPTQTTFMVPDFHNAPPIGVPGWQGPTPVQIPRCVCEHGIAAHGEEGTACSLCDCKKYEASVRSKKK